MFKEKINNLKAHFINLNSSAMKKFLILLSLAIFSMMAWATSKKTDTYQLSSNNRAPHVETYEGQAHKCHCGGTLTWSAKCFSYKQKCSVCKGKGKVKSGSYTATCTMCKGKGWYWNYKSGYICKKYGAKYSD